MATEIAAPTTNRPYPPASTVITVLERLRSRNLPSSIDDEYLRDAGVPDSLNARTLFALRFLNLVVDDRPSEALRSITTSDDDTYRSLLDDLVRAAYHEVFEVIDPAQDSQDRILGFFRRYTPASQRARMVNFFLGMCKEAGIVAGDVPRARPGSAATATRPLNVSKGGHPSGRQAPQVTSSKKGEIQVSAQSSFPPALELLIHSLPKEGTPMSQARRDQWIAMARATLAYVYPDTGDEATTRKQGEVKEA